MHNGRVYIGTSVFRQLRTAALLRVRAGVSAHSGDNGRVHSWAGDCHRLLSSTFRCRQGRNWVGERSMGHLWRTCDGFYAE